MFKHNYFKQSKESQTETLDVLAGNYLLNSKPIELLEGRCRKGSNREGQQSPQQ